MEKAEIVLLCEVFDPEREEAMANVMIEIPMRVGTAYTRRRMMKSRNAPPPE